MKELIYLDYAAATPLDEGVLAVMQPYFSERFYNPSASYWQAKKVAEDLAAARSKVAGIVGARPPEIVFTAGGTEANNLAIHGVMRRFPGANLVLSSIEHESVLAAGRQYQHHETPVTADGIVTAEAVERLIDSETVLVSIMYANNEVGTIQPIRELARLLERIRKERRLAGNAMPLFLHTDAAQAANYLDLHVSRLGVDLMTLNGGKIYGPKQSGALYVRGGIPLEPLIFGGGQEYGMRSGTENVAGDIGFAAALELAARVRQPEANRLRKLQHLAFELLDEKIPAARINGSLKKRLPNNIHITIPGQDNERLLFALDEAGIMAAAGSACSASKDEPSHVLRAMGLTDLEARASLRLTLGRDTTEKQIRKAVSQLASLLA